MSNETLAEIAAREAAEAEREPDELEPDDAEPSGSGDAADPLEADAGAGRPVDTPDDPPAPAPLNEAQIEALWASLDREAERHAKEVAKRAGPLMDDLVACPCCTGPGSTPGYIFPVLPEPDQTMRRMFVLDALGGAPELELEEDAEAEQCERCRGKGKLKTHSYVQNQDTRVCPACGGQGWRPVLTQAPVIPLVQPYTANQPASSAQQTYGGTPDMWGRPPGHPHYGKHPAEVGL